MKKDSVLIVSDVIAFAQRAWANKWVRYPIVCIAFFFAVIAFWWWAEINLARMDAARAV